MADQPRKKQPPVKVEWERIHECVTNCIADYAISLLRAQSERQPKPGRWEVKMTEGVNFEDQMLYKRVRRDVVDAHGVKVTCFGAKAASELVSALSPDVIMVMLQTIESMSQVIAGYRNVADNSGIHTAERVRRQIMGVHCDSVPGYILDRVNAIRREHQGELPDGCLTYEEMLERRDKPKGRGRVLKYNRKKPKK